MEQYHSAVEVNTAFVLAKIVKATPMDREIIEKDETTSVPPNANVLTNSLSINKTESPH